jgi:hypothetical protein
MAPFPVPLFTADENQTRESMEPRYKNRIRCAGRVVFDGRMKKRMIIAMLKLFSEQKKRSAIPRAERLCEF